MVKEVSRRVVSYREAVVENSDRPRWDPRKAERMAQNWSEASNLLYRVEVVTKELLEDLNVPVALRGLYYSFARRIDKLYRKGATKAEVDAEIRYWVTRGLKESVLRKIAQTLANIRKGKRGG